MMREMMSGFGFALLGILVAILLIVLAVSVVMYVFESLGFYTIAKRRGIQNAWLAWIPVAKYWIVGSISDQYQYVVKGRVRNKRLILLLLGIASTVISGAVQGINISNLLTASQGTAAAVGFLSLLSGLLNAGLSIAVLVIYFICMYDLYTSCSPQNNVMFLVLSIIFRVTEPFFIFFNRNKDDGMPPRKEESQLHIPEPVPEPWEDYYL